MHEGDGFQQKPFGKSRFQFLTSETSGAETIRRIRMYGIPVGSNIITILNRIRVNAPYI